MTREDWGTEWRACYRRLTNDQGLSAEVAFQKAREITTARFGPEPHGVPIDTKVSAWFLGRKLDAARKGGSTLLKLLDGNKRLLMVLGFVIGGVFGWGPEWVGLAFRTARWDDTTMIEWAKTLAAQITPVVLGLMTLWATYRKMRAQRAAGATLMELNKPIGIIKAAIADDQVKVQGDRPVTLVVASEPLVAEETVSTVSVKVQPLPLTNAEVVPRGQ